MRAKGRKRLPTMADVAARAGVSQTTVSFVINDVKDVSISDETRERVLAAIGELDYRPNVIAQGLRTSRTRILGFISDRIATTPYAGNTVLGAQDAALANGKMLLLVNTSGDPDVEEGAVELLLDHRVEGILYASVHHRVVDPPVNMRHLPAVLVDCYCEDRSLPSVVPDEVQGGRTATELLLRNGHRRIGFINSIHLLPARFGRLEGYRRAVLDWGLPLIEEYVRYVEDNADGGYQGTMELMQLPDPPTAIFCFNDRAAMGAYDALRELKLEIPKDVAVVGYDNQEIVSAHLRPRLSTVELPHYEMGRWATEYLIEHVGDTGGLAPVQHVIECPLIERSSV
jgi:LacI family transcriptional regulator